MSCTPRRHVTGTEEAREFYRAESEKWRLIREQRVAETRKRVADMVRRCEERDKARGKKPGARSREFTSTSDDKPLSHASVLRRKWRGIPSKDRPCSMCENAPRLKKRAYCEACWKAIHRDSYHRHKVKLRKQARAKKRSA